MTSHHQHQLLNHRFSLKGFLLTWMILWGCVALPAWGQEEPQALPWSQLAPEEQTVLTPFKEQWGSFPPSRQYRLQQGAQRYQQMTPPNNSACGNDLNGGKPFLQKSKNASGNDSKPFDSFPLTNDKHSARNIVGFGTYPLNADKN